MAAMACRRTTRRPSSGSERPQNKGNALGQVNLGTMYDHGHGVPQNSMIWACGTAVRASPAPTAFNCLYDGERELLELAPRIGRFGPSAREAEKVFSIESSPCKMKARFQFHPIVPRWPFRDGDQVRLERGASKSRRQRALRARWPKRFRPRDTRSSAGERRARDRGSSRVEQRIRARRAEPLGAARGLLPGGSGSRDAD